MAYGRLDVFWPDGRFETYPLEAESVSIGRSTGNTIALDTDTISRYHLSITHEDDKVYVTDLDSANGTFVDGVRLESNKPRLLEGVEEIQLGHIRMLFHPVDDAPTLPMSPLADDTVRIESPELNYHIEVRGPEIAVSPGAYTSAEVLVTNLGDEEQQYAVSVSGMPDKWVRVNRAFVAVEPNATEEISLNFKPARRSESAPGEYVVKVRISPLDSPDVGLEAEIPVTILPFSGFGMALASQRIAMGQQFRLHLHNQGSAELPIRITGRSQDDALNVEIPTSTVTLTPGQRLQVQGLVKPRKPVLFGAAREHPFDLVVHAQTPAGFVSAVRGVLVETPRFPAWAAVAGGAGILVVLFVLALAAAAILAPAPPNPQIVAFAVNSTQIARGDDLILNWQAADAASFTVSLNGTPVVTGIDPQVPGLTLGTSDLYGEILVGLQAVNGDARAEASQLVRVYQPINIESFTVTPSQMVRNVVQTLNIAWNAPGAVTTRITGLESFSSMELAATYGAQASVDNIIGIPVEAFTVSLVAEDEVGNTVLSTRTVEVVNAECASLGEPVTVYFGPDELHQVVGTIPPEVRVVVDAQDESGQWLRVQLTGGAAGWSQRDAFACAENFNVNDLRKEVNVPPPPTFTPPPTLTPTPVPPTAAATGLPATPTPAIPTQAAITAAP